MRQENGLTMILHDTDTTKNGGTLIASCLETDTHYLVYESDYEDEYYMMIATDMIAFHMNQEDKKGGKCEFDVKVIGTNDTPVYIPCTIYAESKYNELQNEEEEKQFSFGKLKPSMAR